MSKEELMEIISQLRDFKSVEDVREQYSGKFMYGKKCLGVEVADPFVFGVELGIRFGGNPELLAYLSEMTNDYRIKCRRSKSMRKKFEEKSRLSFDSLKSTKEHIAKYGVDGLFDRWIADIEKMAMFTGCEVVFKDFEVADFGELLTVSIVGIAFCKGNHRQVRFTKSFPLNLAEI